MWDVSSEEDGRKPVAWPGSAEFAPNYVQLMPEPRERYANTVLRFQ